MPLAPEFEATSRLPTSRPPTDDALLDRPSSSVGSVTLSLALPHVRREVERIAARRDDGATVPVLQDGRRGGTEEQLDDRWLLYLQAEHGDDDWHLFRVDLHAPAAPAVDLTPLPPGARVLTVDGLATVPGAVLVSMDERPGRVDHVLVDVETGRTTADLPAGAPGWRPTDERRPTDAPGGVVVSDDPR